MGVVLQEVFQAFRSEKPFRTITMDGGAREGSRTTVPTDRKQERRGDRLERRMGVRSGHFTRVGNWHLLGDHPTTAARCRQPTFGAY